MKVNFLIEPELILDKNIDICDLFSNGEVTLNKDSSNLQLKGNNNITLNSTENVFWSIDNPYKKHAIGANIFDIC